MTLRRLSFEGMQRGSCIFTLFNAGFIPFQGIVNVLEPFVFRQRVLSLNVKNSTNLSHCVQTSHQNWFLIVIFDCCAIGTVHLMCKLTHNNCIMQILTCRLPNRKLFRRFCQYIVSARKILYLEHQYPFQNGAIANAMCESLRQNPELRLIVVTPIKTDLPTGLLGEFFNWSQDHSK